MAKCEWLKMYGSDVVPGFPVVKLLLRTSREGLEKERKEKTTPYGVNLMRSQVLYRAAQHVKACIVAKCEWLKMHPLILECACFLGSHGFTRPLYAS
jgi:hypothetical protein